MCKDYRPDGRDDLSPESSALPERELIRVIIFGSSEGVLDNLYELQQRGYAQVSDWSRSLPNPRPGEIPTPHPGEVMRILTRYRLRRTGGTGHGL